MRDRSPIPPATRPEDDSGPDQVFTYLQLYADLEYHVLICRRIECRHAISPEGGQVTAHLWNKHSVPLADRLGLAEHIRDNYSQGFRKPTDAALPPCGSKPLRISRRMMASAAGSASSSRLASTSLQGTSLITTFTGKPRPGRELAFSTTMSIYSLGRAGLIDDIGP
ncbi:uncharacterized protein B0I36DRAFT_400982 [Microdochium trichocladiopsis]|uniref:Uncharacterized protein n=1 Tax=Microdochium trichocladiopsis TaxID=1682393 RepID=A0A9P9BHK6_9PEZI|nr:uncharacterized protein B0I36DRAFT_400982 [Microdochium trichocladiopsis]KAH7010892.1 hypothetical protein B0I36DRAFT_400982 [Microdochium trichocladiopsis]